MVVTACRESMCLHEISSLVDLDRHVRSENVSVR